MRLEIVILSKVLGCDNFRKFIFSQRLIRFSAGVDKTLSILSSYSTSACVFLSVSKFITNAFEFFFLCILDSVSKSLILLGLGVYLTPCAWAPVNNFCKFCYVARMAHQVYLNTYDTVTYVCGESCQQINSM